MYTEYYKEYSYNLDRDMEFKVYGHAGIPFIVFPCQNGKFYDFENEGMVDTVANFIEEGRMQLFSIQSIDDECWSGWWDQHDRIMWHEQWFKYVTDEFVPMMYKIHNTLANEDYQGPIYLTGASMGGYYCVNFLLRRPDIFKGCLSLSGLFHAGYFFPNYNDETIYYNSPVDYLPNMGEDNPLVDMYRQCDINVCCGQGAWEDEAKVDARIMADQFDRLHVPANIDLWGYDVVHDWPWWRIQFPYFVEKILSHA